MKTKVKITIEVEETWEETVRLSEKIQNEDITIGDVFNPDCKVFIKSCSMEFQAVDNDSSKEPQPLIIEAFMYTRGVKSGKIN